MEVFLSTHSYKLFGTTCIAGGIHKDNKKDFPDGEALLLAVGSKII